MVLALVPHAVVQRVRKIITIFHSKAESYGVEIVTVHRVRCVVCGGVRTRGCGILYLYGFYPRIPHMHRGLCLCAL